MYANTARTVFMTAIISDPNAAVPRWYRSIVLDDCTRYDEILIRNHVLSLMDVGFDM